MMMWFLLLLYIARTELVISQGSPAGENRLVLKGEKPCEGHIEIYHDGEWGYVGHTYWDLNIEKVVCRSAHCGEPEEAETIFRPDNRTVWLNDVKCTGNEKHLWECEVPGWGVLPDDVKTVKKIRCSDKIDISLDGHSCAGAVQYSINGIGGYFCADANKWGQGEANVLCESLGCGSAKRALTSEWAYWEGFKPGKTPTKMLDCSGIKDYTNLWQCVTDASSSNCKNPVSVICTGHERLQLRREAESSNVCRGHLEKEENGSWKPVTNSSYEATACNHMHCGGTSNYTRMNDNSLWLNCTSDVSVVLMDNKKPSRCYGAVHIQVNGVRYPVCASTWTDIEAQVVCSELNCGKVVSSRPPGRGGSGIMNNVKCSGNESSLWHCDAKRVKNFSPFQCSETAYVACSESVNMTLMDGLGECAGRVEIFYEGKWQRIRKQGWTDINSNTVCKQRKCGNSGSADEKFSQGSGEFLAKTVACKSSDKNISECAMEDSSSQGGNPNEKPEVVSITCEGHKVVFLEGTCSGKVGIEHGDKSYWLSGNSSTWNNETADTVCRQMHCGKAFALNSTELPNANDIWKEVYNCSPDSESLFRCEATELPSDYIETTIATVTCEGSLTMTLTEGCWGSVNVCMGGNCGGVCKDSWTPEKSEMLCKQLGCGDKVLTPYKTPDKTNVIFKSLHKTKNTANLTECNFVKNYEEDLRCEPAYVVCSGSARPKFDGFNSRYNCSGNVEVFYEGQFLPVCLNALNDKTQNAICEELKCGQAVKSLQYFGQKSGNSISQIQCPDNAKSLTACTITRNGGGCALGGLQCSKWRKVGLHLGKKACSGDVFVESKEGRMAVSNESWTDAMGRVLCQDLNCGEYIKSSAKNSGSYSFWSRTFSCQDDEKPENIWKCETARQPSQRQQQQLSIECRDPNVTLSEKCHGEVRINNTRVCISNWTDSYSNKLCQEKSCGSIALFHEEGNLGDMYQVNYDQCDRLGECSRYKTKCSEGAVSVYCVHNVEFRTTEKCGGEIEVRHRGKWEKVCKFPATFQNKLCEHLNCTRHSVQITRQIPKVKKDKVNLEKTVDCGSAEYQDYKYCVKRQTCIEVPAAIYCEGYDLIITPESAPPPDIMPIIVGIGLVLLLVILIAVFIRVCMVRRARAKRAMNASSRMYSRGEEEFESGDYEDVNNKANEMKDFSHGKFRPDAEFFMESDARSNTSLPYDDIDEAVETRPLTSPAATNAGATVDNYFQDGTLDQSTDGVTYEVDDPQQNYDDIEPGPEVSQTKAEVHASPETTPESVPAAPPGRAQGDEDYLVPGQDG